MRKIFNVENKTKMNETLHTDEEERKKNTQTSTYNKKRVLKKLPNYNSC